MLPLSELQNILTKVFKIPSVDLTNYTEEAHSKNKELETYLIEKGIVTEEKLYTAIAEEYHVEFISLKGKEIVKTALLEIPEAFAEAHSIIAYDTDENAIQVAMSDPTDIQTVEFVRRKTSKNVLISLATPRDIKEAMRHYHTDLAEDLSQPILSHNDDLEKAAEELPIVNIVRTILEHSVFESASDIHIEPTESEVVVRFRIDGELREMMRLPKAVQNGIVARIKILSHLKIDEHMIPQDGRFKTTVEDRPLSFRVSIIPVYDGEKIVMRLLHEGDKPLTLEELGFLPEVKIIVEEAITKPHGMVLVTGPTGSGKTTTLYSILGILNQSDVNICTIEDPIEYHVAGINQSQINPKAGFTFASGLRAFLRQDPDIIMVGEIRDKETAEIGIHAAMTGHLVLSTLHTNDAPTTIPRLLDMDIPPFLVAFTANIIIAQRLVRKICPHCTTSFELEARELKQLQNLIDKDTLISLLERQHIELSDQEKQFQSMTFFRGAGCARCNKSGYKGRVGIYEVLLVDDGLMKLINAKANASEIKEYALGAGMITLLQDGIVKAKLGITTIEEVLSSTKE